MPLLTVAASTGTPEIGWMSFAGALALLLGVVVSLIAILKYNNAQVTKMAQIQADIQYIKESLQNLNEVQKQINTVDKKADTAMLKIDQHIKFIHGVKSTEED